MRTANSIAWKASSRTCGNSIAACKPLLPKNSTNTAWVCSKACCQVLLPVTAPTLHTRSLQAAYCLGTMKAMAAASQIGRLVSWQYRCTVGDKPPLDNTISHCHVCLAWLFKSMISTALTSPLPITWAMPLCKCTFTWRGKKLGTLLFLRTSATTTSAPAKAKSRAAM